MAHRQEEKARLRAEREAAEQAAAQNAARRKRLGIVLGAVLVAAIAVVVGLAAFAGGDDGTNQSQGDTNIPAQRIDNLAEAARAANCEVTKSPVEGRDHTGSRVTYETNPPTSGNHDPQAAADGIYAAGNPPDLEQSVHALEHGRINVQYRKGTPAEQVNQLERLFEEEVKGQEGYHTLLYENQTNMTAAVAATAWSQSLTCPTFNDEIFDAIRAFRRTYVDKGPEFIP